jgi:hypothetical protein
MLYFKLDLSIYLSEVTNSLYEGKMLVNQYYLFILYWCLEVTNSNTCSKVNTIVFSIRIRNYPKYFFINIINNCIVLSFGSQNNGHSIESSIFYKYFLVGSYYIQLLYQYKSRIDYNKIIVRSRGLVYGFFKLFVSTSIIEYYNLYLPT